MGGIFVDIDCKAEVQREDACAVVEKNSSYVLEVPYLDDQELVMDVLRHGAEVEVFAPADLRKAVRLETSRTLQQYQSDRGKRG